jgi:hypothetical protein
MFSFYFRILGRSDEWFSGSFGISGNPDKQFLYGGRKSALAETLFQTFDRLSARREIQK